MFFLFLPLPQSQIEDESGAGGKSSGVTSSFCTIIVSVYPGALYGAAFWGSGGDESGFWFVLGRSHDIDIELDI